MTHDWKWLEKSPMKDGSGIVVSNGVKCKVCIHDLVTTKHCVAYIEGIEVARGAKFNTMLKALHKVTSAIK